jgi:hypothetical protein
MMTVDASVAGSYNYVSKFTNVDSQSYTVKCMPKIGPDGGMSGTFSANTPPVSFSLAAGATQYVAFDSNSQGACIWAPGGSIPTTSFGQWAGVWKEFDFGSGPNGGWCGADCSALVSISQGMNVPGCKVCFNGDCSTINPGGSGTNAYTAGTAAANGLGLNIPPGKVVLDVSVGYQG